MHECILGFKSTVTLVFWQRRGHEVGLWILGTQIFEPGLYRPRKLLMAAIQKPSLFKKKKSRKSLSVAQFLWYILPVLQFLLFIVTKF